MSNVYKDTNGNLVAPELDANGNIPTSVTSFKTPNGDSVIDDTADAVKTTATTAQFGEDGSKNLTAIQNKPVVSGTYSATPFTAPLTDVDILVKASEGNLMYVEATNINAAIRYLQIHNKASAPASGNTATLSYPIPAGSSTAPSRIVIGSNELGNGGLYLATGIAIGISTAAATFTAATTTDHCVNGSYV